MVYVVMCLGHGRVVIMVLDIVGFKLLYGSRVL